VKSTEYDIVNMYSKAVSLRILFFQCVCHWNWVCTYTQQGMVWVNPVP